MVDGFRSLSTKFRTRRLWWGQLGGGGEKRATFYSVGGMWRSERRRGDLCACVKVNGGEGRGIVVVVGDGGGDSIRQAES